MGVIGEVGRGNGENIIEEVKTQRPLIIDITHCTAS